MADPNETIKALLDELTGSGSELGLQVAAYVDGELVIDACSGVADEASGQPVTPATLFTVFSTSKGITATCIHMLAERGLVDYDAPIATYWPEFAAAGKERVRLGDALTHRAGVPQMPEGTSPELLADWDRVCAAIAALPPLWEPGTKTGYHALTFGYILGEVLRRVDGRPIAQFLQEEICGPLGIDSLFFGIPDAVEPRVATLKDGPRPADMPAPPPDALVNRAIPLSILPFAPTFNRPDVRRASIPAGGGIMNARSLARVYGALARGGELDGARLLSQDRIEIATKLQTDDVDQVIGMPTRKALGYFLGGPLSPMGPRLSAFGHPGAGGSIGFADPELKLGFGITKNLLTVSAPEKATAYVVAEAVRAAIGVREPA